MQEPKPLLRIAFLTHEPFYPPSGGGSAEALYLVEEMVRRGHEVHIFCPQIDDPQSVEKKFRVHLHQFNKWQMGRYTKLRNLKYLAYPVFLERMAIKTIRATQFNLIFSQHAIAAVAAGKLKRKFGLPVVMNFPDLLTGFMETWPRYIMPRFIVGILKRYEISMPSRYNVDGVCTVSDTLANYFVESGFAREKICPIYYGYDAGSFPFRLHFPSKPAIVAMHGSLDFHHLGKIAFEAIQHVTENRPGTIFRFIGKRTKALEKLLHRAQSQIPHFKFEATGFVPYVKVASYLADASVGIVPYEESAGTHCAFVAKIVEYVAVGLPAVCTPLKSIESYFGNDPMVRFSRFEGADFGRKIIDWLDAPPNWQLVARHSAQRVQTELDWNPLCRKAIDFVEKIAASKS